MYLLRTKLSFCIIYEIMNKWKEERKMAQFNDNYRTTSFMIVTYADPLQVLDLIQGIKHCFAVYHNKDFNEDMTPKIPHYHIIITFKNARYYSAIKKVCKQLSQEIGINTFVEPCRSLARSLLYALHQDEESMRDEFKSSYNFDDAVFDDSVFWSKIYNGNDDAYNEEFLYDLLILDKRQMAIKYGKSYICNWSKYEDFKLQIMGDFDGDIELLGDNLGGIKTDIQGVKTKLSAHYVYSSELYDLNSR